MPARPFVVESLAVAPVFGFEVRHHHLENLVGVGGVGGTVIRHPSFVIRHPSSIVRHPSSVIRHPSSVRGWYLDMVVCLFTSTSPSPCCSPPARERARAGTCRGPPCTHHPLCSCTAPRGASSGTQCRRERSNWAGVGWLRVGVGVRVRVVEGWGWGSGSGG